jgi:predicted TPR repeat methyltransferase
MKRKSERHAARDVGKDAGTPVAETEMPGAGEDLPAAIARLQHAASLDPASEATHYALGCAWLDVGEAERAGEILAKLCVPRSPFADRAAAKISEAHAMLAARRSPPPYVRHLFDQFAEGYDRRMLDDLGYCAHRILRGLADMLVAAEPGTLDVLDLGCGTGLAGEAFKDLARRLDGVDLSPAMIGRARDRGIYDALAVADVECVGNQPGPDYDLIVSADTLVYLGDLGPVFRSAARRLKPGGFFLFTVEQKTGAGYGLGPKRRYGHSEPYLREEAARGGFEVMGFLECSPRQEANIPVAGFAVALQRN